MTTDPREVHDADSDTPFNASRWQRLCDALGAPPGHGVRDRFDALRAAYAEPQRHYHTAQHIGECLARLDGARAQIEEVAAAADTALIEVAIWLHDVVYDPTAHDNEARSAAVAREWFGGALAADRLACLARWIVATQAHEAAPDDAGLQALLDIDLSILAAAPARFAEYEEQVRREYAHVPEGAFREGRHAFLRTLAARERLFHHPAFVALEAPARANLKAALA
jgi:predicted metal-dependent HD superfamily phosphohydrolase